VQFICSILDKLVALPALQFEFRFVVTETCFKLHWPHGKEDKVWQLLLQYDNLGYQSQTCVRDTLNKCERSRLVDLQL